MAREHGRCWPLSSFFAVGLAQQPMLVGITLPAYSVHFAPENGGGALGARGAFGWTDCLVVLACVAGISVPSTPRHPPTEILGRLR
jgi:hypothetical protein